MDPRTPRRLRRGIAAVAAAGLAAGAFAATMSAPAQAGSLSGSLYVDTGNSINKWVNSHSSDYRANNIRTYLASQPVGHWFTTDNASYLASDVQAYFNAANSQGKLPLAVLYMIPERDCSQYSLGGAGGVYQYQQLIDTYANNAGNRPTIVILETDSLALTSCLDSTEEQQRYSMLKYAVQKIKSSNSQAKVYLDAGHSQWGGLLSALPDRMIASGIQYADGFFSNVSNYNPTSNEINYGRQLLSALQSKGVNTSNLHQIIDTSRNGNGAYNSGGSEDWCNPPGRKIGTYPTLNTGESTVDAYLWVKIPGESDGTCKGGPSAGTFWEDYAYGLTQGANPPSQTQQPTTTTTTTTRTTTTTTTTTKKTTTTTTSKKPTKVLTTVTRKTCRTKPNGQKICKTKTVTKKVWPGN